MKAFYNENKNTSIFIICLIIASMIWLSMSFSKKYTRPYIFITHFSNIPVNKKLITDSILLKTSIESQGWDILFKKISHRKLIVDLSNYSDDKNVVIPDTKTLVQEQFNDLIVKNVSPTFLTLYFKKLKTKKLLIKLNIKKNFPPNFYISSKTNVTPDSIIVSSDAKNLKDLNEIETVEFTITEKDTNSRNIELIKPSNIQIEENSVNVSFVVEEYIEKEFTIPISIVNNKENIDLIIFPEQVKLTCLVPIKIYENITASDFYISADFNNIEVQNNNQLFLDIKETPQKVKNVQLEKDKIEFIIYQ